MDRRFAFAVLLVFAFLAMIGMAAWSDAQRKTCVVIDPTHRGGGQ